MNMNDEKREAPTSFRMYDEVGEKVKQLASEMYEDNLNATLNILLMEALRFQVQDIEMVIKKYVRAKK